MYIFFIGVKGVMEFLINYMMMALAAGVFLVGIAFICDGLKNKKLTIQKAAAEHIEYIKQLTKEQEEEYNHLLHCRSELEDDIGELKKQRELEQERAREAKENTDRLLKSEQGRLSAELQRKKELGEIEFEQEKEKREQWLNLYFEKLRAQEENIYKRKKEELQAEIVLLQSELNDFKARQDSVNEAILRQKELKEKEDFYSIQVTENDKEDIKVLQSMDLKLHNRDVIPKLVWELYIRRPCQEMIKRITGGRKVSGIYKITNKETGEAYIGKTTDISTRWQNHCKTAIGLEAAARATLHNRLAQDGLWNYTFEIIEEVDKENLSLREAFYIDLYGTKKQLNMKSGDKNDIY